MEDKRVLRKVRITNILLGTMLLITIGFFFYGLINNIQAQKDRELAMEATKRQFACEAMSAQLRQKLADKERELMNTVKLLQKSLIECNEKLANRK